MCGYVCVFALCRFILEPKSVLMNEQEQKLNGSETAIASLLVYSTLSDEKIFLSSFFEVWVEKVFIAQL